MIVEKVINIDQNSHSLNRYVKFPNCRSNPSAVVMIELVANCVHTADATQLDASASAVCILGITLMFHMFSNVFEVWWDP